MSRQLSRIRSIISEIEEIQKQGQSEGKAQLQQRPQIPLASTPIFTPPVAPLADLSAPVFEFKPAAVNSTAEEIKPGKIAIQLTGNIFVALQIENTDEVVEIRQVNQSIEIRFSDGKAVHLPLKNVA
jgi:uncharacterized membrane protein